MELSAKIISGSLRTLASIADDVRSSSGRGASEHQQIGGDDAQPDPTLHAAFTLVSAAPQAMRGLKRADPSFIPRGPTERGAYHSRSAARRLGADPSGGSLRRARCRAA